MRYKLTSVDGMLNFELRDGVRLVVGRAPKSDIPIIDPTISRRHAELESSDSGFTIRDLGSSNGTYHWGDRRSSALLDDGDLFEAPEVRNGEVDATHGTASVSCRGSDSAPAR